jgi:hypothetical protein
VEAFEFCLLFSEQRKGGFIGCCIGRRFRFCVIFL